MNDDQEIQPMNDGQSLSIPERPRVPVRRLRSLAELSELCRKPLACLVAIDGQMLELPCRRLFAYESALARRQIEEVIPPVETSPAGEKVYNFADPGYREQRTNAERTAKAMLVWLGCELFSETRDKVTDRADILKRVEEALPERVLDAVHQTITGEGVGLANLVDFISTASPPS